MLHGLYGADLGGHLLKKRIARPGGGKRGGFRALVVTDREALWFSLTDSLRANAAREDEAAALKDLAVTLLNMTPAVLQAALQADELTEVLCHAQEAIENSRGRPLHRQSAACRWLRRQRNHAGVRRVVPPPVPPLKPAQIKRIRESSRVSQAVFAALLNTSVPTVQKWEVGQKKPTGIALKLLHLVQKNGLDIIA